MAELQIQDILEASPLIPVCAIDDLADAVPLALALHKGGIDNIEVTLRTGSAQDAIKAIKDRVPEMLIGAGTVLTAEQVYECGRSGVSYIVSPGYSEEVHRVCEDHDLPYLPGAVTPTEIQAARARGLTYLKFFPAAAFGGVKTLRALAPVFPDIKFCATGGIGLKDINDYMALANVIALGMSAFSAAELVTEKDWDAIEERVRQALLTYNG